MITTQEATRDGALITAAQTGQVMVGPYATQQIITDLVGADFGTYITEAGTPPFDHVIGFLINERGRAEARRLRQTWQAIRDEIEAEHARTHQNDESPCYTQHGEMA